MNVPRLRFKGFEEDWISLSFGEITDTITSGSRDWAQYYSKNGSKFIRMTNLTRDGIQLKLDDLKFVDIKHDSADGKRTSLIHGDILISITAELGKIGWIPPNFGEAYINQHTALIRLNKAEGDSKFVAFLLSTAKLNKQINKLNDAGAKAGLNLPTIKSIKIQLPKLNEQTKIANFLTAIDEKITQLTQKYDLLVQYKKGVMQQIFSQKLRFKDDDGREFPEWEERILGEIADVTKLAGYEFTKHIIYRDSGKIIALRGLNVKENKLDLADVKFIDESDFSKLNRSKLIINDLLFTYVGTIGNVALITENDRFYLAPNVSRIRVNTNISEVSPFCTKLYIFA